MMTRERWIEVLRIVATGVVALLFWRGLVPIQLLWVAVAVGLYLVVISLLLATEQDPRATWHLWLAVLSTAVTCPITLPPLAVRLQRHAE